MRSLLDNSRWRGVGVALVAVLVLGVAAATASAAKPEFLGEFPNKFTVAGGSIVVESTSGAVGVCNKMTAAGSITGHKAGTAILTLSGCGTLPGICHTEGKSTEVTTTELEVVPVYISKAEKRVALEFKPKVGTTFAKVSCSIGVPGEIKGSILATVGPINSRTKKFTTTFQQTAGIQKPSQYENETGGLVNSWLEFGWVGHPFEREGWEGTATLTTEKETELGA